MKRLSVMFQELDDLPNEAAKIQYLQNEGANQAFMMLLKMSFDGPLVWEVPFGHPPYKESLFPDERGTILYKEARRFYIFLKDGVAGLKQMKREKHFQDLLEAVHPDDAKLVVAVKDKRLPWKTITAELINKAFPGYINMDTLPVLEKIGPNKGKRFTKKHKEAQAEGAKKMWERRKAKKKESELKDGQDVPV